MALEGARVMRAPFLRFGLLRCGGVRFTAFPSFWLRIGVRRGIIGPFSEIYPIFHRTQFSRAFPRNQSCIGPCQKVRAFLHIKEEK